VNQESRVSVEIDPQTFAFAENNLRSAVYHDIIPVRENGADVYPITEMLWHYPSDSGLTLESGSRGSPCCPFSPLALSDLSFAKPH
jgi:hypothetical protein